MRGDVVYEVSWKAGKIKPHASSEKNATQIAIEWMLAKSQFSVRLVEKKLGGDIEAASADGTADQLVV